MSYRVESIYTNQAYRFTVTAIPTIQELKQQISSHFSITQPIKLSWVDQEGDKIQLRANEDVQEAFANLYVKIYTTVTQTVVANTNSPITTISDNPITTVPITTNTSTNTPITTLPIGNTISAVPISGNNTNVSPITDSPVTVTNLDGSPITTNVIDISGVNVVSGNTVATNVDQNEAVLNQILDHNGLHFPSLRPISSFNRPVSTNNNQVSSRSPSSQFIRSDNAMTWLPILHQLQDIGYFNVKRNIRLLNKYNGDYLRVLQKLASD